MKRIFSLLILFLCISSVGLVVSCKKDDETPVAPQEAPAATATFTETTTPAPTSTVTETPTITSSPTQTSSLTSTPTSTSTPTPTIVCRTGGVFGQAVTNADNNTGTGYTLVSDFCLGESGSITALSLYTTESVSMDLGVYHNNVSNEPGDLVFAYGPVTTVSGWNTIGVGSNPVTAGTYWLGFYAYTGNPSCHVRASTMSGRRRMGNGDFPSTWSPSGSWNNLHHCMEGFYTVP